MSNNAAKASIGVINGPDAHEIRMRMEKAMEEQAKINIGKINSDKFLKKFNKIPFWKFLIK